MANYTAALTQIESVFASSSWRGLNISTIPVALDLPTRSDEHCVTGVYITGRMPDIYQRLITIGFLEVQIFTAKEMGQKRGLAIADLLDERIQDTRVMTTTFRRSALSVRGNDPSKPALFRIDYRIPFFTED